LNFFKLGHMAEWLRGGLQILFISTRCYNYFPINQPIYF